VFTTTAGTAAMTNPILYVEELRRYPLRNRKPALPGTVTVFRSRRGRLTLPKGGFTSGELFWRGPRVAYEVDVTEHPFTEQWSMTDSEPGGPCTVAVSAAWAVHSPIDVVAHRLTDAPAAIVARLRSEIHRVASATSARGPAALTRAMRALVPSTLDLVEGLRVTRLDLTVLPRRDARTPVELVRHLLAGSDESAGDPDPATLVRRDQDLVRAARSVLADRAGIPAEERDAVLAETVRRLGQLTARLRELLAAETGRPES
jgi:hypothetical protein